jgi:1-phosphatidylinositol-4-phosphate 5-kinase
MTIKLVLIKCKEEEHDSSIKLNNSRKWHFSMGAKRKKVKIFQNCISYFEAIMKSFKISYQDIIKYLINSSFDAQNDADLNERVKVNGGRSGAFFYKTADQEFIIKTITEEELQTFKSIIKDYTERITSVEGSMLAKVFGIFKVKIEKCRTFRVILMENLASRLENPIIFDLKGSKLDRQVSLNLYSDINLMSREKVYKDIDFAENVSQIFVSNEEMNSILIKIKKDAGMLEKHLIMDYSLLLIMENTSYLRNSLICKEFIARQDKFVVFAGVIDFLQTYNIKKQIEHRYKKLKNKNSVYLSAIAPIPYRKRFIRMLRNIFVIGILN